MIGELFILQPEQHGFLGMEWFATKCGLMESFVVLSLSFSFVSGQALSFKTNRKSITSQLIKQKGVLLNFRLIS